MPSRNLPLAAIPPGHRAVVCEIRCPPEDHTRLMELGLVAGTVVEVIRFAPLGDPVEIRLRGSTLSLRCHEAGLIWVAPQ